jgi:type III secretion protein D
MHDALLEVLEGEVHLGDKVLAAGTQSPWAMHAPLKIGRSVVAFGRAAVGNWPAAALGAPASTHVENPTPPAMRLQRTPLRRRAEFWLATMGAAVLMICGGAFWTARLAAAPHPEAVEAPPPFAATLKASEFSTLESSTRKDGQIEIHGRLATTEQRTRLDAWLAERQVTAAIDVQVDEALARDVAETFRVNGVAVRAQVLGTGIVAVEAAERDFDRLARAEEVARRDVRGLAKLTVRNIAQPLKKAPPPVADDPGKRIASLVPGEPAYLVTADGSRYFVGSILPTGHRITDIAATSVTLEYDGEKTTLNF